jgi:nucleotidyltransferase/DNA polymerase involved in DNA repair
VRWQARRPAAALPRAGAPLAALDGLQAPPAPLPAPQPAAEGAAAAAAAAAAAPAACAEGDAAWDLSAGARLGSALRDASRAELGIVLSVGVAPNKLLAKLVGV